MALRTSSERLMPLPSWTLFMAATLDLGMRTLIVVISSSNGLP